MRFVWEDEMRFWINVLVFLALSGPAAAQAVTYTDTVQSGSANAKYYRVQVSESGQFLLTLSWDNRASSLGVVISCDPSDPTLYGIAAAGLDRFARLEAGIDGPQLCVVGVASGNIGAAYRLNIQLASGRGSIAPLALSEVTRQSATLVDGRLIEEAQRALIKTGDRR
jgi:hypothetical protein